MAHQGRNGHPDENYADMSQYQFGQTPYTYNNQRQEFSPQHVLDQNDTNLMAEFFANPDTTSANESFFTFGMDGKMEFNGAGNAGGINNDAADAASQNPATSLAESSQATLEGHMAQQAPPQFAAVDYSNVYLSDHQQPSNQTAGDTVAGASALMGLSSSQDSSNPLSANNYASWGNIVADSIMPAPHENNNQMAAATRHTPNIAHHPQSQMQAAMGQHPSWMTARSHSVQPRTRSSSLQLETINTHVPSHQQTWQQPQSAYPHAAGQSRPAMFKFGSDDRFSMHGFQGQHQPSQEEKHNNLLYLAGPLTAAVGQQQAHPSPHLRGFRPVSQQQGLQRHSMSDAVARVDSTSSSPGGIVSASAHPGGNGWGFAPQLPSQLHTESQSQSQSQSRKRRSSQMDEEYSPLGKRTATRVPKLEEGDKDDGEEANTAANKRRRSNARPASISSHSESVASSQMSPMTGDPSMASSATRARRATRESRQPRQNLTDAQKRSNHIASEQKRRDAMKTNFEELNNVVPSLHTGSSGLSRSEILQHAADFLEYLQVGNRKVAHRLGIRMDTVDQDVERNAGSVDDDGGDVGAREPGQYPAVGGFG